jgi:hypothetical protein
MTTTSGTTARTTSVTATASATFTPTGTTKAASTKTYGTNNDCASSTPAATKAKQQKQTKRPRGQK